MTIIKDAHVFVCGDWWHVIAFNTQTNIACVSPPGNGENINVYVPRALNQMLELAECIYWRYAKRPEPGSLWRANTRSKHLGHEEGDVILVIGPAANGHGIECDNSSGPVVYPEAWWHGTVATMVRVE